jgi:hypothetical protein
LEPLAVSDGEAPEVGEVIPELQIDTPTNRLSAKEQAAALRKEIEERLDAIEFPVEVKVDKDGQKQLDDLEKQREEGVKRDQERQEQRLKDISEKQRQVEEALTGAAIDSAQNLSNTVFSIKKNQLEREQNERLSALDVEEQKAIEAANGNAAQEALIRKNYEKKRQELEREGARERKKIAIKEALINTALAITKALTGAPPPFNAILAGAAAIAGALQVAEIRSQEFWQGGKVKRLGTGKVRERQNAPRTAHGDTVLAYLKPGEMVLNEPQQAAIAGMAGNDVFERAGVPGVSRSYGIPHFATGGLVDFVPQTGLAQAAQSGLVVSANATFTEAQVSEIGRMIGAAVANTVGREVRTGIGEGLGDANRRLEREQVLNTQRQG